MPSFKITLAIVLAAAATAGCGGSDGANANRDDDEQRLASVQPDPQFERVPNGKPPEPELGRTFSEHQLLLRLRSAGMTIERLDKTFLYPDDQEKLPAEPRQVFSIRVSDGQGNRERMTLVEFDEARQASLVKGVNGFPAHNWFFLGTISTYFRRQVEGALS